MLCTAVPKNGKCLPRPAAPLSSLSCCRLLWRNFIVPVRMEGPPSSLDPRRKGIYRHEGKATEHASWKICATGRVLSYPSQPQGPGRPRSTTVPRSLLGDDPRTTYDGTNRRLISTRALCRASPVYAALDRNKRLTQRRNAIGRTQLRTYCRSNKMRPHVVCGHTYACTRPATPYWEPDS